MKTWNEVKDTSITVVMPQESAKQNEKTTGVKGIFSYGPDDISYTFQLSGEFSWDIKGPDIHSPPQRRSISKENGVYILNPLQRVLVRSKEKVKLPKNLAAIMVIKSSYTDLGIMQNVGVIDPGYEGYLRSSLFNSSNMPVALRINEGFSQLIFWGHGEVDGYDGRHQNFDGYKADVKESEKQAKPRKPKTKSVETPKIEVPTYIKEAGLGVGINPAANQPTLLKSGDSAVKSVDTTAGGTEFGSGLNYGKPPTR